MTNQKPWPGAGFVLPLTPVFAVSEVTAKDASGADVLVSPEAYTFIPSAIDFGCPWAKLLPTPSWPGEAVSVSITCTAGWDADKLPESLRSWALTRIATLYDHREDLIAGMAVASLPRHHTNGLLDRWTVRSTPYG